MRFQGNDLNWVQRGKAAVVVDGQFGSTGKGLAAAWLMMSSAEQHVDVATCNAGANAGHTTKFHDDSGFVCFHLPTTGVINKDALCYINAGSIIEPAVLKDEIAACGVRPENVVIHPRAAVITEHNRAEERLPSSFTAAIASTQKGVGAAISDKVMRRSMLAGGCEELFEYGITCDALDLNGCMTGVFSKGQSVVVEVPQGLDLSLNHGLAYPYVTSRDCWVGSGMSDAGIHPSFLGRVAMVVRTFPIRVGDLYNERGEKLGTSGPFYSDSVELNWNINFAWLEPERTTVTKRVRRIATWSDIQYQHALSMNRPDIVFVNFCNYFVGRKTFIHHLDRMRVVENALGVSPYKAYGFGPCPEDVVTSVEHAESWFEKRSF